MVWLNGIFLLTGVDVYYITALPCDEDRTPLLDPKISPVIPHQQSDNWTPYKNRIAFELAEFLYRREQMSAGNADILLELWAATLACHNDAPPFSNHQNLYDTIDATPIGGVPWQSATLLYDGPRPEQPPLWMESEYMIWFRDPRILFKNMIENPDFAGLFDYTPYRQYDDKGKRRYEHFMSGNWAWKQAVSKILSWLRLVLTSTQNIIAEDPETHGAMFVPIILGSDKTTVSVATGHVEYWPLYGSIGNIHNNVRRGHGAGLVLVGFLSIPKSKLYIPVACLWDDLWPFFLAEKEHATSVAFRVFRRKLFHTSISLILQSLRPGETTPEVYQCPDQHYRRVIWGIGPYIADYPEQVLLACIVQDWCAKSVFFCYILSSISSCL